MKNSGKAALASGVAALLLLHGSMGASAQEPGRRPQLPIVIEADPNFDACGANGVVEGLDPSGDGFLAVRSEPGSKYREIDRLYNGAQVFFV